MEYASTDQITCWRRAPADEILWASWGDDHVAFHRPSGKTHFLNLASYQLINELLHEPRSETELIEEFVAPDSGAYSTVSDEISALLERFEQLGLIERV